MDKIKNRRFGVWIAGALLVVAVLVTIHERINGEREPASGSGIASEERSFSSFADLPADMPFVDEETYRELKNIYDGIDFYGEYKSGDAGIYDFYKDKYADFIKSGGTYIDKDGNEGNWRYDENDFLINKIKLYFFDMDEDETPELGVADIYGTYIIKYIPDRDAYYLWWGDSSSGGGIPGSRKIRTCHNGDSYGFYQLDKSGEEEFHLVFAVKGLPGCSPAWLHTVSLPHYREESKQIQMSEHMEGQAYFGYLHEDYYFRVTEEQYDILLKAYFLSGGKDTGDARVEYSYFFQ